MSIFFELGDVPALDVWNGVTVRAVHGEQVTVAVAELAPDVTVPEHTHANEQVGVVLQGSAVFTSDGQTMSLRAGGVYRFLGGVPHAVTAGPEGAVFAECFAPPRSDWAQLHGTADASPRWPSPR